jgi:peroxiredoxin
MSTTINKYPYFDLSEIVPDNDLAYKNYKPLQPVKAGNHIPGFTLSADFTRWKQFYNGAPTHGHALIKQLLNSPLVISFYSRHWNNYGLDQLKYLNAIQYEIRANGGNLLIINADNDDDQLEKQVWENNLSLNFYQDKNNELAEKFRVYSEHDPTWNNYAGIDANVPLLATYVIDTAKHIVFDHIDKSLSGHFNANGLLAAVHEAAYLINRRHSA